MTDYAKRRIVIGEVTDLDSLSERLEEAVAAQHAWFRACEALKEAEAALIDAKDAYSRSVDALIAEAGPDRRDDVMAKYHGRCLEADEDLQ